MKIAYIGHSGFAVELSRCTLLFDYFEGELPAFDAGKPLYVFASHMHRDHFNFAVFSLRGKHPDATYILSRDIRRKWGAAAFARQGVERAAFDAIVFVRPHERLTLGEIVVETLDSTDAGVAFLVTAEGKTLFHAGDLNDWVWEGEPAADNAAMTTRFRAEVARLGGRRIDAAFLVLDPRQENDFARGFDWFMRNTDTARAYPMHFWHDLTVFERLRALPASEPYRARIASEGEYV